MTKNTTTAAVSPVGIVRDFAHKASGFSSTVRLTGMVGDFTIQSGNGKATALPHASLEYLIEFGLQALQDAYAGKSGADVSAAFDAKLAKLVSGELAAGPAALSLEDATAIEFVGKTKSGPAKIKEAIAGLKGRAVTSAKLAIAREFMGNEQFAKAVNAAVAAKRAAQGDVGGLDI